MNTPLELTQDYISTHDLRKATQILYLASTRALLKHFGQATSLETINHRSILEWRKTVLANGLSKQSWNTYSNHLRTVWGFAIEQDTLTCKGGNPFKKTRVIPPRRPSKIIPAEAIRAARNWLKSMIIEEHETKKRSKITPAWFWLAVFEMFYYTGMRLSALLNVRYQDIDWKNHKILIRGETEKTHREFIVPIMPGMKPHLEKLMEAADKLGFKPNDQLFNVNRFSRHYRSKTMNIDQVEGMFRKLIAKIGVRMTPHRFRHTLATDLMRQPERNIHLTKNLLNHSNISTTMGYVQVDYDVMREVLHARSITQGAITLERFVDEQATVAAANEQLETAESPLLTVIADPPEPLTIESVAVEAVVEATPIDKANPLPIHQPQASKLLTQVMSLPSERYSLEEALMPVGTGLSHELTWDGPGTWWQDLSLPPTAPIDEELESSALFNLMISRGAMKSHDWG